MTDGYFKITFRHKICAKATRAQIAKIYELVNSTPNEKLRAMSLAIVMERIEKLTDDPDKFARFECGKIDIEEVLA